MSTFSQVESGSPEKDTCERNVEHTRSWSLVSAEGSKPVHLVCPHVSQVEAQSPEKDTCDGNVESAHSSSLVSVECPKPVWLVQRECTLVGAQDHEEDTSVGKTEPICSSSQDSNPVEGGAAIQSSQAVDTETVQPGCPGKEENQRGAPTLRQSVGSKAPSLDDGNIPVPSTQAGEAQPESSGIQPMEQKTSSCPRAPPWMLVIVLLENERVGLDLRTISTHSSELPRRPLISNAVSVSRQLLTTPAFPDNRLPACLCQCHCQCGSCCACHCKCN